MDLDITHSANTDLFLVLAEFILIPMYHNSDKTDSDIGIISITRYRDIDRGFVELTISRHLDVGRYHARMHTGQHAICSTIQNGNNYRPVTTFRTVIIISRTVI